VILNAVVGSVPKLLADNGPFIPEQVVKVEQTLLFIEAPLFLGMVHVNVGHIPK
jgi:hypothetical protein